jgi:hypothetical protein
MTAAALDADIAPPRRGWRSLLWVLPLTGLRIALNARKAAIAWNVFGLLDFAVAVSIGLMIAPGALQVIVPSIPNVTAGIYPNVMIPAIAVPSSILLHALLLRQLKRQTVVSPRGSVKKSQKGWWRSKPLIAFPAKAGIHLSAHCATSSKFKALPTDRLIV